MATTRDWSHSREMWIRVLKTQTGRDLNYWNARIAKKKCADAEHLRTWLAGQGVTGYGRQLLVMEHFGYPDFVTTPADELIDAQYADRPHLRPIYEAIVAAAQTLGEIVIQARKGYVSLLRGYPQSGIAVNPCSCANCVLPSQGGHGWRRRSERRTRRT